MARALYRQVPRRHRRRLAALLRERREEAGLRQEELAARPGATQTAISDPELGERRLGVLERRLPCAALGAAPEAFVARLEAALRDAP